MFGWRNGSGFWGSVSGQPNFPPCDRAAEVSPPSAAGAAAGGAPVHHIAVWAQCGPVGAVGAARSCAPVGHCGVARAPSAARWPVAAVRLAVSRVGLVMMCLGVWCDDRTWRHTSGRLRPRTRGRSSHQAKAWCLWAWPSLAQCRRRPLVRDQCMCCVCECVSVVSPRVVRLSARVSECLCAGLCGDRRHSVQSACCAPSEDGGGAGCSGVVGGAAGGGCAACGSPIRGTGASTGTQHGARHTRALAQRRHRSNGYPRACQLSTV